MRCTIVLAALAAQVFAQQSILPITQISDGQIQAPPATSDVVVPVPVPSSTDVGVVPTTEVPIPSGTDVVIVPLPTTSAAVVVPTPAPSNGTVPTTGAGNNSTAILTSGTPTPSGPATSATASEVPGNGASMNMVSFGGVALAVAAMVFT